MAKKKAKRKKRYYPTEEPGFRSRKHFNRHVRRRARRQIQPLLQDIRQRRREAAGAHKAREADIDRFTEYDVGARTTANQRLQEALTGIMGGVQDLTGDASAGLQAALRQQADAASASAAELGVAAPGMDPQLLAALGARSAGNRMGLAGEAAGMIGRSAADIGIAGVEGREAGTNELNRYQSIRDALSGERSDVRATLPQLIADMRSKVIQEQLAMEQQELAEDQFGEERRSNRFNRRMGRRQQRLAEDQFGEQKRAGKHARKMARKQAKLDRDSLNLAKEELAQNILNAGSEQEKKHAQARADRFNAGVELLSAWIKPTDQEQGKGGRMGGKKTAAYQQRLIHGYQEMVQQIMASTGMGPVDARRVVLAAADRTSEWGQRWVERAQREIHRIKLNRRRKQEGVAGPPSPIQ